MADVARGDPCRLPRAGSAAEDCQGGHAGSDPGKATAPRAGQLFRRTVEIAEGKGVHYAHSRTGPVFHPGIRYRSEVGNVSRQQDGIVGKRDRGDLEVHTTQAGMELSNTLEHHG
jgi:hypothetical protein